MKLVRSDTKEVFVEFFKGDSAQFANPVIHDMMKVHGIRIPESFVDDFAGKEIVLLKDPLFKKAFIEIFYRYEMDRSTYVWIE